MYGPRKMNNLQHVILFNDGKYVGHVNAWEPTWRDCKDGEEPGDSGNCPLVEFGGIRSSIANFLRPEVHRISWKLIKGVAAYAEKLAGKPVYIGLGFSPLGIMASVLTRECGFTRNKGAYVARSDQIDCRKSDRIVAI
jgi:hypothetical protein